MAPRKTANPAKRTSVAAGLGLPLAVVEIVCADLQAAGMIAEATRQ